MDSQPSNVKQSIVAKLQQANNILVTVSRNPSVDQLSTMIGFTLLLNKAGKHTAAVYSGATPSTIEFLKPEETVEKNTDSLRDFIIALDKNKADKLRYKIEDDVVKIFITPYRTSISDKDLEFSQGDFNVEAVVALGVIDQNDLDDAIMAHGQILHDASVITLTAGRDISNLGSLNWHESSASSLAEMITDIGESLDKNPLDEQIATALLTGIVAETDRFSNEKTTPRTMTLSAQLMGAGANQQLIASELQTFQQQPDEPQPLPEVVSQPQQNLDELPALGGTFVAPGGANPASPTLPQQLKTEEPQKAESEPTQITDPSTLSISHDTETSNSVVTLKEEDAEDTQIEVDDQGNLITAEELANRKVTKPEPPQASAPLSISSTPGSSPLSAPPEEPPTSVNTGMLGGPSVADKPLAVGRPLKPLVEPEPLLRPLSEPDNGSADPYVVPPVVPDVAPPPLPPDPETLLKTEDIDKKTVQDLAQEVHKSPQQIIASARTEVEKAAAAVPETPSIDFSMHEKAKELTTDQPVQTGNGSGIAMDSFNQPAMNGNAQDMSPHPETETQSVDPLSAPTNGQGTFNQAPLPPAMQPITPAAPSQPIPAPAAQPQVAPPQPGQPPAQPPVQQTAPPPPVPPPMMPFPPTPPPPPAQ